MRSRPVMFGVFAAAAVALTPAPASAACSFAATLGFGGTISGCWADVLVAPLWKNAQAVSQAYSFLGFPGTTLTGTPASPGLLLPGVQDGPSNPLLAYLQPTSGAPIVASAGGNASYNELVFALNNITDSKWLWTGPASRNLLPPPGGIQNILLQVDGPVTINGTPFGAGDPVYLVGWEDLNSNCSGGSISALAPGNHISWASIAPPTGGAVLKGNFVSGCTKYSGSDNDFNDFYMLVDIRNPGGTTSVTPEPMTMSLLATGLIAMGGASLRRRKKNQTV